ncbi:UNVERIFIED_CONTAM: hypothetical protein Sindi_2934000, partial [Sesamum indicum]
MSLALFRLIMEYFPRLIKRKISIFDFNFHPKGDLPSIYILMECLQDFKDSSGLTINTSKSCIFTADIQNEELDRILARTEFVRGEMPVRLTRTHSLSYSGVGVLLASNFPTSSSGHQKIHRLCRNFIWNPRGAPVAREKIAIENFRMAIHPAKSSTLDPCTWIPWEFSIRAIDVAHVFIKFVLEEDYLKLWMKSILFVEGFPMRVINCTLTFNPRQESSILPMKIGLEIRTEVIIQPVIYKRLPKYCGACKHLGHDEDECYEKYRSKVLVRPVNRDGPQLPIPDQEDLRVKLNAQREEKNLRDRRKGKHGAEDESQEAAFHKDVSKTVVEELVHSPNDVDDGTTKLSRVTKSVDSHTPLIDEHHSTSGKETVVPDILPIVPELGEYGGPCALPAPQTTGMPCELPGCVGNTTDQELPTVLQLPMMRPWARQGRAYFRWMRRMSLGGWHAIDEVGSWETPADHPRPVGLSRG